ncbi:hypothetical protein Scep_024863 [Stephania cephalantha]|uniref:Uncharacterized protein n=1 Tax=Stephania cephalantha TaxID=152367 RepID=A0AAP0F2P4_9MAGN
MRRPAAESRMRRAAAAEEAGASSGVGKGGSGGGKGGSGGGGGKQRRRMRRAGAERRSGRWRRRASSGHIRGRREAAERGEQRRRRRRARSGGVTRGVEGVGVRCRGMREVAEPRTTTTMTVADDGDGGGDDSAAAVNGVSGGLRREGTGKMGYRDILYSVADQLQISDRIKSVADLNGTEIELQILLKADTINPVRQTTEVNMIQGLEVVQKMFGSNNNENDDEETHDFHIINHEKKPYAREWERKRLDCKLDYSKPGHKINVKDIQPHV